MRTPPVLALLSSTALLVEPSIAYADGGATWLPGGGSALSRATSASPDTPALELRYGPRLVGTVGIEVALLELGGKDGSARIGVTGLVSAENETPTFGLRDALWREAERVWIAFELVKLAHAALGHAALLELDVGISHEGAHRPDGVDPPDPYRTDDVPFGAGGYALSLELGTRLPLGTSASLTSRLGLRLYTNAFPGMIGQREASDAVASGLTEGAETALTEELVARVHVRAWPDPVLAAYAEQITPHDDSAHRLARVRLLAGGAIDGRGGMLLPFAAFDGGAGDGLLVNRTELRLAIGMRYAPW